MKTKFPSLLVLTFLAVFAGASASAQSNLDLPDASQRAAVMQRVGMTDITINYNRPLVKGRKIWGGLVPMGKVWRAGANENTTIEFSTPISVEGKPLPAGKYGLHTIPNAEEWTIIFSKMSEAWGSYTYSEAEDVLRVQVKPRAHEMEEALEYDFEDLQIDSAVVTLKWEKLAVPFRVAVNDADSVFPSIRAKLRGRDKWNWQSQLEAAQYALSKKTNLEEGLQWAEQSIQLEERFENLIAKSDIFSAMNKAEEAKKARDAAMEKASAPQLYSYARQLQREKKDAEAMALFPSIVKRFPETVAGHLAQARIKSAAGDFAAATAEAKKALGLSTDEEQKASIQGVLGKLQAGQDINR